jgi:hypothetical protein
MKSFIGTIQVSATDSKCFLIKVNDIAEAESKMHLLDQSFAKEKEDGDGNQTEFSYKVDEAPSQP